jgi:hypothetical protein
MRCFPLLAAVGLLTLPGCGNTPARLSQTTFNARTAATDAISACDKNNDGKLDENELDAIPAIKNDLPQFDKDNNKSIDANEIAERLEQSQALKVALVPCSFVVKLDGKPLADADVTLEPESFLASTLQPCIGKTDPTGRVSPSKTASNKDGDNSGLTGVPPGLYKLKIIHPKLEKLPQYHSETKLGLHVASDNPNLMMLEFALTSK